MHTSSEKLQLIKNKIKEITSQKQLKTNPEIIVVSKMFSMDKIMPLIEYGQIHFGENKVQEAEDKWPSVRKKFNNLKLHLVGKLQSNKAKKAVALFDYIHSLDNAKLASKIFQYEKELNKKINLFIQVNLANESQKSGILINDLNNFYSYCTKDLSLKVVGLMCLPPIDLQVSEYFKLLKNTAVHLNLKDLSMGMSADFEDAVVNGSTFLRLGTKILGKRPYTI